MIPKKTLGFKAIAVAAAVDMTGKVVAHLVTDHSIDKYKFAAFLDQVNAFTRGRQCVMLVDNLSVHYTDLVKRTAQRYRISLVYNGTYSSEFNPIERLWAWSK